MATFALAGGEEPAQADPVEVQRFLTQLEAEQLAMTMPARDKASGERSGGTTKRIKNIVESAAKRAPSTGMLNKIETAVVGRT